jgi:hypothetical protein
MGHMTIYSCLCSRGKQNAYFAGAFFMITPGLSIVPSGDSLVNKSPEELSREYRKWYWCVLLLYFLFAPPLVLAWFYGLNQMSILVASQFSDAVFQARISGWAWIVPALLPGWLTACLLITTLYRWGLKERYSEYTYYRNLASPYEHSRVTISACIALVGLALLLILALLHWRTVFTEDKMISYPFFSISSTTYSYSDIIDIQTASQCMAPSGKIVDNGDKDHVIYLSDGYKWSTRWLWAGCDAEEKQQLIEFVSNKSGKPVHQMPILEY